jgi:PDDEXK-like domain of unknown function (DUF3799)
MSILEVSPRDYHTRLQLDRSNIFSPDSWLSKSRLWELRNCSLYKWRYYSKEFTPSDAMRWGSMIDCYITTPDEVVQTIIYNPFPDFRTKAAQELRDTAIANGQIVASAAEREQVELAVSILRNHRIAGPIIANAYKQVVLLNQIKGINVKSLVDLVPTDSDCLYDLKTTAKLSIKGIANSINDFGYHVQAAIYLKLWNLGNPDDPRSRFRYIWQDSSAPYEVVVTEIPTADIEAGGEWAAHQIGRLIKATKDNHWPNIVGDKVAMIGRPAYAMYQDEEDIEGVTSAPELSGNGVV